jgi:hypothetical protein
MGGRPWTNQLYGLFYDVIITEASDGYVVVITGGSDDSNGLNVIWVGRRCPRVSRVGRRGRRIRFVISGERKRGVGGCGGCNWKFKEMLLIIIDIDVVAAEPEPGKEFLLTTMTPEHHHPQELGMQPVIFNF